MTTTRSGRIFIALVGRDFDDWLVTVPYAWRNRTTLRHCGYTFTRTKLRTKGGYVIFRAGG